VQTLHRIQLFRAHQRPSSTVEQFNDGTVPVDQPHDRRTYVPRHHDAGVVHPVPNEPRDPEEPVPVDQPHDHRTYVPRHHEAGVVRPVPNEPHDPEEPVPVDQPHARRTYVPRHNDAGVVHPQPNEPHNPEELEPVDQPHANENLTIEPLASPTLDLHPEDIVHRLTQGRIPTTRAPTANGCILLPMKVAKVAATTLIDTRASALFISAKFAQRLGAQFHRTHA
jgi:hypothetical protein